MTADSMASFMQETCSKKSPSSGMNPTAIARNSSMTAIDIPSSIGPAGGDLLDASRLKFGT
jgi:hypothetical protein